MTATVPAPQDNLITLSVDDVQVSVPKGTLVIRAAEQAGIAIPRFCDHPLLDPVGACRQCMVEVPDAGNGRGFPKPQASCTLEAANGMQVKTQATSQMATDSQRQILELLLINHPLDCPICDKGGECPLQNQAMADGQGESRFDGIKRTYPKPIPLSSEILLDRERCVLCARCTRFSEQISGDTSLHLLERGAVQQVGIYPDQPYDSYFSGNVVQICPVGALTNASYRFSARPFDLVSTTTTCENCAAGCQLRVDQRHGDVRRRYAGNDPEVNEEWNCDLGRFGFVSNRGDDRITRPLVRRDGQLAVASWPEALEAAAEGLKKAAGKVGVLTGGRLTTETAYAYSRFARAVLGTDSVDFRSRATSAEETAFLAAHVAGARFGETVTYADLETAKKVVLVGFEPEDESPLVFLRLRKAVRKKGLVVAAIAPYLSRGSAKLSANLVPTVPGNEARILTAASPQFDHDTVILAGERLAESPGALTALVDIAATTGARWAWIPRRPGEIGALQAGLLPGLLPGGRPFGDQAARQQVSAAWGSELPADPGYEVADYAAAAERGDLAALLISGAEAGDMPDPTAFLDALAHPFVVSLENRLSDIAAAADVVLPVSPLEEIAGSFLDWEHRVRPVAPVAAPSRAPMTEIRVLSALATELGADLGFGDNLGARASLDALGPWSGARPDGPRQEPGSATATLTLASWRELIDDSRHSDGEEALAGTARPVVARVSPATARQQGLTDSPRVEVAGDRGSLDLPLVIDSTMADGVVWVPRRSRLGGIASIGGGEIRLTAQAASPASASPAPTTAPSPEQSVPEVAEAAETAVITDDSSNTSAEAPASPASPHPADSPSGWIPDHDTKAGDQS
ncbi:MAG: NADH-quinone oxidoreductase subunit G [Propionibacteriaceae bacterium]|jgi:NADH-quinone oxidoreductase subunit G|nr:NADH-quinone oxidoreductase subunit G [Propionibacteriaceae bacterium]